MAGPVVVAMGDSVTAGVGDGAGAGWAFHVATMLGARRWVNLAANGVRARDMNQSQVPSALMELPDVVLATVGGNDVLRGDFDPLQMGIDVRATVERLSREGRRVVFISLDRIALFELMPRAVAEVMARRVGFANQALAGALEGTQAALIDGSAVMRALGPRAWHIDRIHPSPAGHRALASAAVAELGNQFRAVASVVPSTPPPALHDRAWWLVRNGTPWIVKRSRDLIPQVATMVTHELLEQRRRRPVG